MFAGFRVRVLYIIYIIIKQLGGNHNGMLPVTLCSDRFTVCMDEYQPQKLLKEPLKVRPLNPKHFEGTLASPGPY